MFILPYFLTIIAPTDLKKVSQLNRSSKEVEVDEQSSLGMSKSQKHNSNEQNEGSLIKNSFPATLIQTK